MFRLSLLWIKIKNKAFGHYSELTRIGLFLAFQLESLLTLARLYDGSDQRTHTSWSFEMWGMKIYSIRITISAEVDVKLRLVWVKKIRSKRRCTISRVVRSMVFKLSFHRLAYSGSAQIRHWKQRENRGSRGDYKVLAKDGYLHFRTGLNAMNFVCRIGTLLV